MENLDEKMKNLKVIERIRWNKIDYEFIKAQADTEEKDGLELYIEIMKNFFKN